MPRPDPSQNPLLHAPRQSAGYQRGAVLGDGARQRYRPPAPKLIDTRPTCDRCHQPGADRLCPRPDDPTFERPGFCFCGPCAATYHAWRRERGLLP